MFWGQQSSPRAVFSFLHILIVSVYSSSTSCEIIYCLARTLRRSHLLQGEVGHTHAHTHTHQHVEWDHSASLGSAYGRVMKSCIYLQLIRCLWLTGDRFISFPSSVLLRKVLGARPWCCATAAKTIITIRDRGGSPLTHVCREKKTAPATQNISQMEKSSGSEEEGEKAQPVVGCFITGGTVQ